MFNLAYGFHWSWQDMMEMPIYELFLFHELLQAQWEREREAAKR